MEKVNPRAIATLPRSSPDYPRLLAEIADPPGQLFARGDLSVLRQRLIAIVGTRRPTSEGLAFTRLLVEALAAAPNVATVSGLAFGIDAAVAETAVKGNRPTVAVLASGVDQPTPTSHERLAADVLTAGGCLLSEYPPGTPADKFRFPERNRVIAGLAEATVVVEAGEPSGALITAYQALEMNRDVFAVPGSPFNAAAAGTNRLIRQGAIPLTCANDLLEALGLEAAAGGQFPAASHRLSAIGTRNASSGEEAQKILEALRQPLDIDQLAEACTIPTERLAGLLSILELEGEVCTLPDQRVVATKHLHLKRGQRSRHC